MKFKSESERKAAFANMNSSSSMMGLHSGATLNRFAAGPYSYSDRVNMSGFSTNPEYSKSDNFNENYRSFAKKPSTSVKFIISWSDPYYGNPVKQHRKVIHTVEEAEKFVKELQAEGSDNGDILIMPETTVDGIRMADAIVHPDEIDELDSYGDISNKMSAGRIPKIGEIVMVPGDESVCIFPFTGHVVKVYPRSADIEVVGGDGRREVVELPFGDFEDQTSIEARRKAENDLYKQWLIEKAEEDANRAMGLQ